MNMLDGLDEVIYRVLASRRANYGRRSSEATVEDIDIQGIYPYSMFVSLWEDPAGRGGRG